MYRKIEDFMDILIAKNPGQIEFHQAVKEVVDSIWSYIGITGAIYFSGAIAVLIGGLYWEKASETGAILALIGGLLALIGLEPIREYLVINLKPEEIGLLSLLFTFLMMFFGSLLFPRKEVAK